VLANFRYDLEKVDGFTTNWLRLFLDWVRCICVLLTAYLRFGDADETLQISAMIVTTSIVPQTLAVVHELWMENRHDADTIEGAERQSIVASLVFFAASLSRSVCRIPNIIALVLPLHPPLWGWVLGATITCVPACLDAR
jgi:hypothetical protein